MICTKVATKQGETPGKNYIIKTKALSYLSLNFGNSIKILIIHQSKLRTQNALSSRFKR